MVLTHRLRRLAAARPHLLLVEGPGGTGCRLAVERWTREHGWPVVDTPADADLLVTVGDDTTLREHLDRVWDQLPGPRSRAEVCEAEQVGAVLEAAQRSLPTPAARADDRPTSRPPAGTAEDEHDMSGTSGHEGHDMSGMSGMSGHDMSDMSDMSGHDMSGMSGHDMSSMGGMSMPAGLAMADRAPDRDGLTLDVLHVPWGPVLPWWPVGLVVRTVLQGDVVQSAEVEQLGSTDERDTGWREALAGLDEPEAAAVVRLDALVRLLGVAGWTGAGVRLQRVRDELLDSRPAPGLARLCSRVSSSRSLARTTRGVPTTDGEDLTDRYRRWCGEAVAAVQDRQVPPSGAEPHVLHVLPSLLVGSEVGGLRLTVAGLDLALSGAGAQVGRRV